MNIEKYHQKLRKIGLKSTKQRTEMLNFVSLNTKVHPTAQQIFEDLSHRNSYVSLGNVYRNLTIFEEKQLIRRVGNSAPARYEVVDENSHFHITCVICGDIQNVFSLNSNDLRLAIFDETKFKLADWRSDFYGTCSECLI